MDKMKIKKDELLTVLKENRQKHKEEYSKVIKAYRVKCADLLKIELEKAIAGESFSTSFSAYKPQSYLKEYDLAIRMFEMTIDDIVELDRLEFSQLVMDDWSWKSSFRSSIYSNSAYFGMTSISGSSYATLSNSQGMGAVGSVGPAGESGTSGGWTAEIVFPDDEIDEDED